MYSESRFHPFPLLESAASGNNKPTSKRILIITQDIIGPVTNGGIGTAYYYASTELARMGHEVSILYTHGRVSEQKDIGYWIEYYRKRGIHFIPCPTPEVSVSPGIIGLTASIPYNAYEWLKQHQDCFDVVHGSEWGANLYYCLLAKKLGLHFRNIHFAVKSSSPLLWNRIGNNEPIHQYGDLVRIFMERKSVEWADYVIGGSHYLLNWMEQNGYQMPEGRCFVQPNIFPLIPENETRKEEIANATELVFFGRLERRKGLHLFVDALSRLLRSHDEGKVNLSGVSITFLGKQRPGYNAKREISRVLKDSLLPWRIIDNLGQPEAIAYLKEGSGKLVVMPSIMDNSPFGVYELLGYRIPFITSTAGGGKELIDEEDYNKVLFQPHPHAIHQALLEKINKPLYLPRPSFDMARSLETWDKWHRYLPLLNNKRAEFIDVPDREEQPLVSICIMHYNRPDELDSALDSIKSLHYKNIEVIIVDDGSTTRSAVDYLKKIRNTYQGFPLQVFVQPNLYPGAGRNLAANNAHGDYLLFMDDDNLAKPDEVSLMVSAIEHAHADIITCFADTFSSRDGPQPGRKSCKRILYTGADLASGLFRNPYGDTNCLVRRSAFEKIGGFTEDYKIGREDQEFFSRAILEGFKLYVLPEATYWYRLNESRIRQSHFSNFSGLQRVSRPYMELPGLPADYANILCYAQGLAAERQGLAGNIIAKLTQSGFFRRTLQQNPFMYKFLKALHRRIA